MSRAQVERVRRLTREEFAREFVGRSRPVVLTGALRGWRALSVWTPGVLGRRFRTRAVRVGASGDGVFAYDPGAGAVYETETMAFGRAVSLICGRVVTGKKYYLMQTSIPDVLPELLGDVDTPQYVGTTGAAAHLWFGAARTVTPLHYDMANNLLAQIHGRKRITLFSPAQESRLYPFPVGARHPHLSRVDIEAADLERFPAFRKAVSMECVVAPGDLLFLPAFWWHHVRSLDVAISVSFWWPPRLPQYLAPAALRMIPAFYGRDRLAGIGRLLQAAGESGGFMRAARFLQARKRHRAAVLFAAAALHEAIEKRRWRGGRPDKALGPHAQIVASKRLVVAEREAASRTVSPSRVARTIAGVESFVAGAPSRTVVQSRRRSSQAVSRGARSSSGMRLVRS